MAEIKDMTIERESAEIKEIDTETDPCIRFYGVHTARANGGPFERFASFQIRSKNPLKGRHRQGIPRNLIATVYVSESELRTMLEYMTA